MITFYTGVTKSTVSFIKDNLFRLGTIERISHTRDISKVFYETTIVGNEDTMVVTSGIGSGYMGEGPSGFVEVLQFIGVPNEKAEVLVYENDDKIHSFTYEF